MEDSYYNRLTSAGMNSHASTRQWWELLVEYLKGGLQPVLNCVKSSRRLASTTLTMQSGREISVGKMIAEGGFSYVFFAMDKMTGISYAVKKVLCQNEEQIQAILNEMEIHRTFQHSGLLRLCDHCIRTTSHGEEYYLLFPLYQRGSLRQVLDERFREKKPFTEKEALRMMLKICEAVNVLHTHNPPLAHRDIKPENILLSTDLDPVLIDFGSATDANVEVTTRAQALMLQEKAAMNCSMPYRAPELFDVPSQCFITGATDVWSIGCCMYAIAFGYSPFESVFDSSDNIRLVECTYLRVIGKVSFPKKHLYSPVYCDLIRWMLTFDGGLRPKLSDVITRLQNMF